MTLTITRGAPIASMTERLITYTYNNVNQVTDSDGTTGPRTYTHEDDGGMTRGYTPGGYAFDATYDAEGRLTSIEYVDSGSVLHRTEYTYGGDGLLYEIRKLEDGTPTDTTRIVRAGFLPIQERDENNNIIREYVWGPNMGGGIGGLLAMKQGGSNYYYLYDGKGNVMALTDSSGNVVATYTYDPFGVLMEKTGTFDQPFRFSTKRYDEGTGHSLFGYRWYNASLGKWMTRDPLGEAGGINLYGFVGNNSINGVDPLGLADSDTGPFGPVPNTIMYFWNNYFDMKESNTIGADKYFHCKANCQAAKEGVVGEGYAVIISEMREFTDKVRKGDSEEVCNEDRLANYMGRYGDLTKPCKQVCEPLRPNGLDSEY